MAVLYKRMQVVHVVGVKMGGVRVLFRVSYWYGMLQVWAMV